MGRIAFVVWDGGGNVPPVLAIGSRLAAAGHEVAGYGPPSLAHRFAAEGLAYVERVAADPWDVTSMAVDVAEHCRRTAPDVVVVDYMLPGALCGAEASDARTVALVHTLYVELLGAGDHPDPMGMAASPDDVDRARAALGMDGVGSLGALLDRADRVVVTSPRELDAPSDHLPANLAYIGPAFEPAGADEGWRPPPGDDPLVVLSLGSTPMDEVGTLRALLAGLDGAPVRVLAMCAPHLDSTELALPANATRSPYVRHAAVLPHAAAVVNHAGLGTVLASLAHGLPMVCVPLGRDQPANARAVTRVGAGAVAAPTASPDELRRAVLGVLDDDSARRAAQDMARTIGGPGAGDRAAHAIEEVR